MKLFSRGEISQRPVTVTQFCRKATGKYSLERVFASVRNRLPEGIKCVAVQCTYESRGLVKRVLNVFEAGLNMSTVNHITGDVHYLAFALPKHRTVLTVADCRTMERLTGLKRRLYRWLWLELPTRRCAIVTVISEFTKRELLRYTTCQSHKIVVIPVPLGEEFQASPKAYSEQKPRILQVGTADNKNLKRLIEALSGLDCHLDIVGPLSLAQRAMLVNHKVSFSNASAVSDSEMVRLYQECDIVVFVSTYEGFGMPIVEANAIGRPVITSTLPPMCDVAADAACLVDPYDVTSIRSGILRVISDAEYRDALVREGFRNAIRFSSQQVALQYTELYRAVASNKHIDIYSYAHSD